MSRLRPRGEEEGQIIPALLLVVVVILFMGLLFVQVGSAAEQKTQTQTAADSGAVAAGHDLRSIGIQVGGFQLVTAYPKIGAVFWSGVGPLTLNPADSGCQAVERNWLSNPHGGYRISCATDVSVAPLGTRAVRVDVTAPSHQVVDGPAKVQDERAKASATARVSISRCPQAATTPAGRAIANWTADRTMLLMGAPGLNCFTPADATLLGEIEADWTGLSLSLLGPPQPVLIAVSRGMRVELVDD